MKLFVIVALSAIPLLAADAPRPQPKPLTTDQQLVLTNAKSDLMEAQLQLVQSPLYLATKQASDKFQELVAAIQKECGGSLTPDLKQCVVAPAAPPPKPPEPAKK